MLTTTAVTGTTATLVQATDAEHPQLGFRQGKWNHGV